MNDMELLSMAVEDLDKVRKEVQAEPCANEEEARRNIAMSAILDEATALVMRATEHNEPWRVLFLLKEHFIALDARYRALEAGKPRW